MFSPYCQPLCPPCALAYSQPSYQPCVLVLFSAIMSILCPCLGAHNQIHLVSPPYCLPSCPHLIPRYNVNLMSLTLCPLFGQPFSSSWCPQSCLPCVSAQVPATMPSLCPRPFANHHVHFVFMSWCPPSCQFCVPALVSNIMSTVCPHLIANNHVNLVSPS